MNRINQIRLFVGLAMLGLLIGRTTVAEVSVEVGVTIRAESDFYEPLTPLGEWVGVGSYGRCWRPAHVEADWQPYCNGYWQRTDGDWYWVSDEPWGWATYHYGRWDMNAELGWFWVPQTAWAPAWVSWHEGGGYIGWAPLPPSGRVSVKVIAPRIVFVEQRHFLEPVRRANVVVNNTTIINKTVVNQGPQVEVVEKASGRKVQPAQVRELRHKEEAVVAVKQRPTAPVSDKKEKNVAPPVTDAPPAKNAVHEAETQKPATQQVRPDEESHARQPIPPPAVKPDDEKRGPKEKKHDQKEEKDGKDLDKKGDDQPTPDRPHPGNN